MPWEAIDRLPLNPSTEAVITRTGTRQQPPCLAAGHLLVVMVPIGLIQRRGSDIDTRAGPFGSLGRRIPCHYLSMGALVVRLVAAKAAPSTWIGGSCAGIAANLDCYRCPPSCPRTRAGGYLKNRYPKNTCSERTNGTRIPSNLTLRPSDLPSGLLDSSLPEHR